MEVTAFIFHPRGVYNETSAAGWNMHQIKSGVSFQSPKTVASTWLLLSMFDAFVTEMDGAS